MQRCGWGRGGDGCERETGDCTSRGGTAAALALLASFCRIEWVRPMCHAVCAVVCAGCWAEATRSICGARATRRTRTQASAMMNRRGILLGDARGRNERQV